MNYTEALSFTFQDENWAKKIAIGGLFNFISFYVGLFFIVGFIVVGYYVGALRNVMKEEAKPLPEWTNWTKIFTDGILGGIIGLIYFLFFAGIAAVMIVSMVHEPGMRGAEQAMSVAVVSILALLGLFVFANVGVMRFAETNDFGAAFNFAEIFRVLKNNFGNLVTIAFFSFILNAVLFLAGLGILSPFTNFWGLMVQAHLLGQCARTVQEPNLPVPAV
jgi:hypothetical protein